jgi:predicted Zn-dependent protease
MLTHMFKFYLDFIGQNRNDPALTRWAGMAFYDMGKIFSHFRREQDATVTFRAAIAIFEELASRYPSDPAPRWNLALSHTAFAVHLAEMGGSPRDVEKSLRRATALFEEVTKEHPKRPMYQEQPAQSRANLAWLLATCPDKQVRKPDEAVRLARLAVDQKPEQGNYWSILGVAEYQAGNYKGAAAALEKTVQLRKGGDVTDWLYLALAHGRLGHRKVALRWYDQAVGWMDKNRPRDEDLLRLRAEAATLLGIKEQGTKDKETAPSKK